MSCAAAAPASPLVVCKFSVRHCRLARASKEGATHSDLIAREAQSLVHLAGGTKISTGTASIAAVRPECGGDGARCCSGEHCCVTLLASIIATSRIIYSRRHFLNTAFTAITAGSPASEWPEAAALLPVLPAKRAKRLISQSLSAIKA
jgi:hypothetical protein